MTSKKTKPGRPAGAKTQDRPVVAKAIARDGCPECGSSDEPKNKRLIRSGQASGEFRGQAYGAYRHYTANCAQCNRALRLTEYDLIPD